MNLTVSCITDCALVQRGSYRSAHAVHGSPFGTLFRTEVWIFHIFFYFMLPALYSHDFENCLKSNILHA